MSETTRDVAAEVKTIISMQLDVDPSEVRPEAHIVDDLGADSLAIVEIILAAEEAFDFDIPDEDVEGLPTVQHAITYVERRLANP